MGEVTNEEILLRLAKIRACPKACPKCKDGSMYIVSADDITRAVHCQCKDCGYSAWYRYEVPASQ